MRNARIGLAIALAVVLAVAGTARWTLQAQERGRADEARGTASPEREETAQREPSPVGSSKLSDPEPKPSVQEALLRPFSFPFAEETTLEEVAAALRKSLGAPVVLDRAALDRQELSPESTVQLEMEGVRLKTGLKLLLDQVALTYRVVPEDNLLVLTDVSGSEDPSEQVLAELKSLHRDVHDLQDAVEDLYRALFPEEEGDGPTMRKPTLLEELPAPGDGKEAPAEPSPRARPG
jgi:hypothetical protein